MFVSDNQEIHNLSAFLELCEAKKVNEDIVRLKIPNMELHKLSYGIKYRKKVNINYII